MAQRDRLQVVLGHGRDRGRAGRRGLLEGGEPERHLDAPPGQGGRRDQAGRPGPDDHHGHPVAAVTAVTPVTMVW